jgi:hypothetical protein
MRDADFSPFFQNKFLIRSGLPAGRPAGQPQVALGVGGKGRGQREEVLTGIGIGIACCGVNGRPAAGGPGENESVN